MSAGITFCCARKKKLVAKNSAKHMRHRCRAMRCEPETPPRRIILTSSMAANAAKQANTKYGGGGAPSSRPVGLIAACKPQIARAAAALEATKKAAFSNKPTVPAFLRTVAKAVVTR